MLRRFRADLHVHTCLSPCGDLEMSPRKIASRAAELGITLIAICDHNSAENVPAVTKAAESRRVVVLPGMEICSREEVHVLAIFDKVSSAFEMQSIVYSRLHGKNDPEVFGLQVVANELDEVVTISDRLLIGAVDLPIDQVVDTIHRLGGIVIASHIDRESFSVISQLGFIPDSVSFDALELSCHVGTEEAKARFALNDQVPLIRNSDAHFLDDIGMNTSAYFLEGPTLCEFKKAFRREDGRMICEN